MKRNIDDIIPPGNGEHRSIRKVSVDRMNRRKRPEIKLERKREREESPQSQKDLPAEPPHSRRTSSRIGLWVVALVSMLILVFGFSLLFSGAKLVITPKQRTILIDASFEAFKTPILNQLGYEIITIEQEGAVTVQASGKEFVEEKASGKITIYNNFNSSSQRLIKNTRFETPEGLIYRINESIVVPGQKTKDGKKIPGSIEVTVYSDEAGAEYNIGIADFTIPGFKGDARFDDFYARSQTKMTGGFVGEKNIVSEADEITARNEMKEKLKAQLLKDVFSQKPEGFEIYEDGVFVTFTPLASEESGDRVEVKEKATLYGILFARGAFAQFVARNTIAGFEEEEVEILDPSTLTLHILNKDTVEPWNDDSFLFTLEGKAHIVWSFEAEQLKQDLLGKSKEALQTVLTGYPSISEAQIVLRPFWRQTFPKDIEGIKITTTIEE